MRPNSESDLWRLEIECELVLELIKHGLQKGFGLDDLIDFISIQTNLIKALKSDSANLNLSQFTRIFHEAVGKTSDKSERELKEFIEFEVETVLKNFNLLRYVFYVERDTAVEKLTRVVEGPTRDEFEKFNMREAKLYDQWLKDEKLTELMGLEDRLKESFLKEQKSLLDEEKSVRNLLNFIQNDAYGCEQPLEEPVKYTCHFNK